MTMSEGDLAVTEIKFVRRETIAPQPAPAMMTGALGGCNRTCCRAGSISP